MKIYFFVIIILLSAFTLNANEKVVTSNSGFKNSSENKVSYKFIDNDYSSNILAINISKGSLDLYNNRGVEVQQSFLYRALKVASSVFIVISVLSGVATLAGVIMTAAGALAYNYYSDSGGFIHNIYPKFYTGYYLRNRIYEISNVSIAFAGHMLTWISFGIFLFSLAGVLIFELLAYFFKNKAVSLFMDRQDNGKLARLGISISL